MAPESGSLEWHQSFVHRPSCLPLFPVSLTRMSVYMQFIYWLQVYPADSNVNLLNNQGQVYRGLLFIKAL